MAVILNSADLRPPTVNYYVATDGNDSTGDGSIGNPWLTMDKANSEFANLDRVGDVIVNFREGTYRQTATVNIGPDNTDTRYKTIYRSYPGEAATLTSNALVSGTWTSEGSGVYSLPLAGQADFRTLTINGKRATRARYPKAPEFLMMTLNADNTSPIAPPAASYFTLDPSTPLPVGILPAEEIDCILYYGWEVDRFRFDHVRTNATQVYLLDDYPEKDGLPSAFNWMYDYGGWYMEGSQSFVTAEKDWYYNPTEEKLYYYPTAQEVTDGVNNLVVEVPQLTKLVEATGEEAKLPALQGDFTVGCWVRTSYSDAATQWEKVIASNRQLVPSSNGFEIALRRWDLSGDKEAYIYASYATTGFCHGTGITGLNDGLWHHIEVAYNVTASTIRIFVDGVEPTYHSGNSLTPVASSDIPPLIGKNANGTEWDGEIDSFTVSDVAVSTPTPDGQTPPSVVLSMPLNGTYDVTCETVSGARAQTRIGATYGAITNMGSTFIDGGLDDSGGSHNPTCSFDGVLTDSGSYVAGSYIDLYTTVPGRRVENLYFSDLTITGTDWAPLGTVVNYWAEGGEDHTPGIDGAIQVLRGNNIGVSDCTIHTTGGSGVYANYVSNGHWNRNTISDIGYNGIAVYGNRTQVQQQYWNRHEFIGNTVTDIGIVTIQSYGLFTSMCGEGTFTNNYIARSPYVGIGAHMGLTALDLGKKDTTIAWNAIEDCMQQLTDGGGLLIDGQCVNGQIHNNHIRNCLRTAYHDRARQPDRILPIHYIRGLHCDKGTSEWTIRDNIFEHCASQGIHTGSNSLGLFIENNIFIVDRTMQGMDDFSSGYSQGLRREEAASGDGTTPPEWPIYLTLRSNITDGNGSGWGMNAPASQLDIDNLQGGVLGIVQDFNMWSIDSWWHKQSGEADEVPYDYRVMSQARSVYEVEENSIVGDPELDENYQVPPGNPAFSLGFENFDVPELPI